MHNWNYTKIQESFSPQIATKIFKLRIPNETTLDQLIWKVEPRGVYSVRSTYRLLQGMNHDNLEGERSREKHKQGWWKQLWGMQIPKRIQMFAWRCSHDILPM